MLLFIDSANINEIKQAIGYGILNGCTTNPSLISREKLKSGRKFIPIVEEICQTLKDKNHVDGAIDSPDNSLPVSIEVLKTDSTGMVEEGLKLSKIATNVVVKLPCTMDGLKACYELSTQHVPVNMTLCFTPMQALLAAKAGAAYVSPFIGRIDDVGEDGLQLIASIKLIYMNYRLPTKILAASIRNVLHLTQCARIGADCATIPFTVISKLMESDLTRKGLDLFLEDARNATTKKD